MLVHRRITYLILLLCFFSCKTQVEEEKDIVVNNDLKLESLELNMLSNPSGIDPAEISFGWKLQSSGFNVNQESYRILVSESEDFSETLIWDSGKVQSDKSQHLSYKGPALSHGKDYYWKAEVWDNKGNSVNSKAAHFFTAPSAESLEAKWIGAITRAESNLPEGRKMHTPTFKKEKRDSIVAAVDSLAYRSIMLRKEFYANKEIKSAKVYVSGLGHYKLNINGEPIGNSEFAPLWTDYDKTVYYNIYDVTSNLKNGGNAIGVMLGNGMYNVIGDRYSKFFVSFGPPTLFLQLRLTYEDGSREMITSDESWKYAKSPVTFNTLFGGEDYDARMEQPGWDKPGFNESVWKNVVIQNAPQGSLIPQTAPDIKVSRSYGVQEVNKIDDTTYVMNMGQNLSGFPKFKARGKKGDKIRIWVGEKLQDDGTVAQGGSGKPYYYEYTFKGDGIEEWRPYFSYYGFQYIQIEGAGYKETVKDNPVVLELNSLFVHNSAEEGGSFESSNEIFNQAHQLINAAIKSNFHSVFTDCPHREKLGWLEETHLNGPGLFYNYHLEGFIPKVMRDIADAQRENGLIPNIAPEYIVFGSDFTDSPEWGLAGIVLPWMYYEYYGDPKLIEEYYPVMKRYVDYLSSTAEDHIVSHGLGDWYDYGEHAAGYSKNSPIALSATSHYFYGAKLLTKAAKKLNKTADVEKYEQLTNNIREAFNKEFYHPEKGHYGTGSQFSNAVPIFMEIVRPEEKEIVMKSLLDTIKANGFRLTTGDVGNRYLFQTLAQNDQNEVMYKMQNHYDTPGYGFQTKFGLTTLTEQWDPRNGNSLNHFMMGQIEEWFYKSLAGIVADEENPGFKHFFLQPELVGDMSFVKASYESLYGKIVSEWSKDENENTFNYTIPANTTATLKLPPSNSSGVIVNGEKLQNYMIRNGKIELKLGSGKYNIKIRN